LKLKKTYVHEIHETVLAGNPLRGCPQKTRTDFKACNYQRNHTDEELQNLFKKLFCFVTFVIFVDEKRLLG